MRPLFPGSVGVLTLAAILVFGCVVRQESAPTPSSSSSVDTSAWVTIFDPEDAWSGYTLAFMQMRIPVLIDMNGRIVHSWPRARVKSRVRLLEDGSLLGITLGKGVVQYDWNGDLVWSHDLENGFAHHDVIRLRNGNTMLVVLPADRRTDDLLEVDSAGNLVWHWRADRHLAKFIAAKNPGTPDLTHINSVQEIPHNPWHEKGDLRFRPGNLMISSRSLNAIFIIDRQTKAVVWSFDRGLDRQHEALMTGPEFPAPGNILLFNNRYGSFYHDRQSTVLEINPFTKTIVWQYRSAGFYSPTSGAEQPLPNGNILISSSRGERLFEITRGGRIVWQWAPPFEINRPQRYPYDHCPQLAALGRPAEVAVRPHPEYRHIDGESYRFARRGSRQSVVIDGVKRVVLKNNHDCRRLIVPATATAHLAYGVDTQRLSAGGRQDAVVRFALRLRPQRSEEIFDLFTDGVDPTGETWKEATIALDRFAHEAVELCVQADSDSAFWAQPIITSRARIEMQLTEEDELFPELTNEELEVQKRHLEALGYIQ